MRNLMFIAAATLFTSLSFGSTLQCWQVGFANVPTPFMTATISSNTTLVNIKFLYKNANLPDGSSEVYDTVGIVKGNVITSVHSPYKGDVSYTLKNGPTLVLPANLANSFLMNVYSVGIGHQPNENGVIIGYHDGDSEGGSHFSTRLVCHSDKP